MEVAVFIDCHGLATADANLGYGFLFEVDLHATVLKLYIDKGDVVLGEHRVLNATHLNTQFAVVNLLHNGKVFLYTCLYGAGDKFGHLLATTEGGYAAINGLDNYVATVVAFIKLGCHNRYVFYRLNFFVVFSLCKDNTTVAKSQIGNFDDGIGKTYYCEGGARKHKLVAGGKLTQTKRRQSNDYRLVVARPRIELGTS